MGTKEKAILYGGLVVGGVVVVLLAKKGLKDLIEDLKGMFKITFPEFAVKIGNIIDKIQDDLGNLGQTIGDIVGDIGEKVDEGVDEMNKRGERWRRKLKAKKLSEEIVKMAKAEDYVIGTRWKIQEVLEKSGDIMDKVAEDLKKAILIGKTWDVYEAKRMRI